MLCREFRKILSWYPSDKSAGVLLIGVLVCRSISLSPRELPTFLSWHCHSFVGFGRAQVYYAVVCYQPSPSYWAYLLIPMQ